MRRAAANFPLLCCHFLQLLYIYKFAGLVSGSVFQGEEAEEADLWLLGEKQKQHET